jgi:hypothetical protein
MNQLIDGQSPARTLFVALAVVIAGLAAAVGLATAKHNRTSPTEHALATLTEPTLATKAHGRVKPRTNLVRPFAL